MAGFAIAAMVALRPPFPEVAMSSRLWSRHAERARLWRELQIYMSRIRTRRSTPAFVSCPHSEIALVLERWKVSLEAGFQGRIEIGHRDVNTHIGNRGDPMFGYAAGHDPREML